MRRTLSRLAAECHDANLRVQSHVLGASLLLPRNEVGKADLLNKFYEAVFDHTAFTFSASPWPVTALTRTSERALWVPRVAQTAQQIEKNSLKQFYHNFGNPECIVGVNCQEDGTSLIVTSEPACNEMIPFLVTPVERKMDLYTNCNSAPFRSQPQQCGVVNWVDVCTRDENERRVALHLGAMFGWHLSVPYDIGHGNVYITAFNGSGGLENRHKLGGILPMNLLLSGIEQPFRYGVPLVFFSCGSEEILDKRVEVVKEQGGKLLLPKTQADGSVAVVMDPNGAPFGLYHRTDSWNEIKPGTETTWDLLAMPARPMPKR